MKKRILVIASISVVIVALCVIIAMHYKTEDDEVYLNPSDETLELAATAVDKLQEGLVFMPGISSSFGDTVVTRYNNTAKWVAPELLTLETKEDASLALIKLYEDLLKEYRSCDLDRFYALPEPPYEISPDYIDEFRSIVRCQSVRMTIEALLALDLFYDQLSEKEIQRMMKVFEEYVKINNASARKFFDDVSTETMFEMFRKSTWKEGYYI